jgi:hypothetical protein
VDLYRTTTARHASSREVVVSTVRRRSLFLILALALVATGVLSSLSTSRNPSILPSGLAVNSHAESTALYCTGLSSVRGGVSGRVTFLNTTSSPRHVSIMVVSNEGKKWEKKVLIVAHATLSIDPAAVLVGDNYGVAAQVSGGGVVAEEITMSKSAEAPCISTGVTDWYGAGFDTTVGSSADVSIYNPTATPAVINVSTYSKVGFTAPARFQGLSVAAHSQIEVNLGNQIVSTRNVGVHVKVVRGAVDIVGVQIAGSVASFNSGIATPSTMALYPAVTTANKTTVQVRIVNPGPVAANITVAIALKRYKIVPVTLSIRPYTSGFASITPNPAVPVAGYASVRVSSSQPVFTSLAAGSGTDVALSSPGRPESEFLIADFSGLGYDAATVTNTSSRSVTLTFSTLTGATNTVSDVQRQLPANTTERVLTLLNSPLTTLSTLRGYSLLVTCSRPVLMVTLTLPTRPRGTRVVSPLDGR